MKINEELIKIENSLKEDFDKIDNIGFYNQNKVLEAFKKNQISTSHFIGTTGYGEADLGREKLAKLFACIFNAEDAIVSPHILCGTHALTIGLFGLLQKGDVMLSISGRPYDTLSKVIDGKDVGSLTDLGVIYKQIDLIEGELNASEIIKQASDLKPKMIYLQRSKGYAFRNAISTNKMEKIFKEVKKVSPNSIIFVDNCYGEFTEQFEPTDVGADVAVGSLTKNIGGGLAPNGGYVVGKQKLIEKIARRLTSPSLGMKVGSYEMGYRMFFQGLFISPQIVSGVLKGICLAREVLSKEYAVLPQKSNTMSDIVLAIKFNDKQKLIDFCKLIQRNSPIDSFVNLEPWDMAGYADKIIMASGSFVEGATLELSCDAPIRPPYVGYMQGGLSYNHIKLALNDYLNSKNN